MVKKKIMRDEFPTIAFRVNLSLYRWIEQQAVDGESPHQVVQRLVKELAACDGVVVDSNLKDSNLVDMRTIDDLIEERVNQRFAELKAVMTLFADDVKRLKRDVANFKP